MNLESVGVACVREWQTDDIQGHEIIYFIYSFKCYYPREELGLLEGRKLQLCLYEEQDSIFSARLKGNKQRLSLYADIC